MPESDARSVEYTLSDSRCTDQISDLGRFTNTGVFCALMSRDASFFLLLLPLLPPPSAPPSLLSPEYHLRSWRGVKQAELLSVVVGDAFKASFL